MKAKEKGYGIKKKLVATVKVRDEKHLKELLAEGNEHYFSPSKRGSENFYIHRVYVGVEHRHYWFIWYDKTEEQEEIPLKESFMKTWLKPYIERGELYCKIEKLEGKE